MLRWWRAAVVVLCLLALTIAITHVESVYPTSTRTSQIVRFIHFVLLLLLSLKGMYIVQSTVREGSSNDCSRY